ncbi:MAG: hypothetical protein ACRC62_04245 [Microcoleus sp.]
MRPTQPRSGLILLYRDFTTKFLSLKYIYNVAIGYLIESFHRKWRAMDAD